jgi:hypothetical protein
MPGLEMAITIAVGCGWPVGMLAGDTGACVAQLVSKTINARSIKKEAATPFQEGPASPGFLLLEINKSSPFKNTTFMIKSISPSLHNAETDINTDMSYR